MAKLQGKKQGKERGAAGYYISRTRAVRKLQLTLPEFRRLAILKGIYPRQPNNRKKAAGKSGNTAQTFYFTKDIQYLLHEPLVTKMRLHKTFLKRISKALGKRQHRLVEKLEEQEPTYTLDHLVKERYPSFVDALRDLDDCLCHVALFATLPQSEQVPKQFIDQSQRLTAEFQNYLVASRSLRKVFLSIKGIYYQAEIRGQTITWIVPYQFSQQVPADVDVRVMLTFLEFYLAMLGFVNFKLYLDANLRYPPPLDARMDDNGAGLLASYTMEAVGPSAEPSTANSSSLNSKKRKELTRIAMKKVNQLLATGESSPHMDEQESEPVDPSAPETAPDAEETSNPTDVTPTDSDQGPGSTSPHSLFESCCFFLSREVPRYSLELVIRCFNGRVGWPVTSGEGSPVVESSDQITHEVVDRPLEMLTLVPGRVYIQPQWIYDCVNAGHLLATDSYRPGVALPPHRSPFVAKDIEGNVDDEEISADESAVNSAAEASLTERLNQARSAEELDAIELEAEMSGVKHSETFQKAAELAATRLHSARQAVEQRQATKVEKERVEMAKMMMSNKKRKMLNTLHRQQEQDASRKQQLAARRRELAKSKKAKGEAK